MAFDYDAMKEMAYSMLSPEQFGSAFTLVKPDGEPHLDPDTLMMVGGETEHTGVGVMRQYTAEMIGALSNIIEAGDVQLICQMDESGVVPTEGVDKVRFGGEEYSVINVRTLNPNGGNVLLHTLQLRKAGTE